MPSAKKPRRYLLLLWPIALTLLLAARSSASFAEKVFAGGIYRVYHTAVARVTDLVPFSLAQWVLYGFIIGVMVALTVWVIHIIQQREHCGAVVRRGLSRGAALLGLIFFLFVLGGGANYYRLTYAELSGLEVKPASEQELYALCTDLAAHANSLRSVLSVYEDAQGIFSLPCSVEQLGEKAAEAMTSLGQKEAVLSGFYPRPKPVLWSRQMSRFGITGVYFPFTVEANVNVDAADYALGASMCHELSHIAGFMREDEANYLAYHACRCSGDPILDYSGTVFALIYAGNALARVSPTHYAALRGSYADGVNRDIAAESAYWEQFEDTVTSEVGERVNDAYLKANRQTSGVQSYGEMVDLLLAEYRAEKNSA